MRQFKMMLGDKAIGSILHHKGAISSSIIEPQYQGLGLGKKMYGELIRRMPGQVLESDSMVSPQATRVWESFIKNPKYKTETSPKYMLGDTWMSEAGDPLYSAQLPRKAKL